MAQTESRRTREKAVYIVDAARTPFLKARTGPGPFAAADLAVQAGRDLLARMPFDPPELDHVVLGSTMPSPDEANIGRVAALRLGCGDAVPAYTVMRNCASGMQAIDSGANLIKLEQADLVLAGGADAMSHAPILWSAPMAKMLAGLMAAKSVPAKLKAVAALRPGHLKPVIALLRGLTDPVVGLNMGQTAEVLAERFAITRDDMDEFAVRSHKRLAAAQQRGQLPGVTTLYPSSGRLVEHDDGVRLDSSVENLAKLKPVFDREFGLVTAGNSSQITDGAAWVLLASEQAVKDHDLDVLARIVDSQWAALDPRQMGLGPV
ncbi:MAG: acetyl-CoA C-acyltransferase, partial [Gammaproteobacteria bacterium]|nr:acetyl-CoA C-acyltransferase [Gammaproteobacteria bacterium]